MPTIQKKKIIVILSVIIFMIGAGWVVWAIFLAPPTKQDFTQATQKAEKIKTYSGTTLLREFYIKTVDKAREGVAQQALVKATSGEKKKTIDALNSREKLMNEIGESRVIRDKDIKKKFDTYQARENRYSKYIKDYLNAFPMYRSSFTTCIDVFEVTKKTTDENELAKLHADASKDCTKDLDTLAKSPITPFAGYAKEFNRIITERQKVFDGVKDGSVSIPDASTKIKKLGEDYSRNDPTDDLNKYGEQSLFKGELNSLIDTLKKKS